VARTRKAAVASPSVERKGRARKIGIASRLPNVPGASGMLPRPSPVARRIVRRWRSIGGF
jgi:hypothetical protein